MLYTKMRGPCLRGTRSITLRADPDHHRVLEADRKSRRRKGHNQTCHVLRQWTGSLKRGCVLNHKQSRQSVWGAHVAVISVHCAGRGQAYIFTAAVEVDAM